MRKIYKEKSFNYSAKRSFIVFVPGHFCGGEAAARPLVCRLGNANVSSVAFVRNTVIRPPAPWVEPSAAAAPTLIYFDVNRKVICVPEGSCIQGKMCVYVLGFGTEVLEEEPRMGPEG